MRAIALGMALLAAMMCAAAMGADVTANQCRIDATPVRFGTINPFATTDARANGTVTYNCTVSGPVSIALEHSQGAGFAQRILRQGAYELEYNLYLDAACTIHLRLINSQSRDLHKRHAAVCLDVSNAYVRPQCGHHRLDVVNPDRQLWCLDGT